MTELEHAIKHIKTRADAWAVKGVTEALQSISERLDKALSQEPICIGKVEFDEDKLREIVKEQVLQIEITAEQEPCTDAVSREDAIESIANIDETDGTVAIFTGKQVIALLKDLPSVNAIQHTSNVSKDVEQHTNTLGDAVSREAVLDAIKRISLGQTDVVKVSMMTEDYVEKLPSVTQKSGKWQRVSIEKYIQHAMAHYVCSECGGQTIGEPKFCPNCGARMESEDKE